MKCIDEAASEKLLLTEAPDGAAWDAHLRQCVACQRLFATLPAVAAGATEGVHPDAAALVAFDEEELGELDPGTRRWVERHLGACEDCTTAVSAVPTCAVDLHRLRWRLPAFAAAAAGVLVVVFLISRNLQSGSEAPPPGVFVPAQTLVVSAVRGGDAPAVLPAGGGVVRLELVLGEDVKPSQTMHVKVTAAHGATVTDSDVTIAEVGAYGWPVLTLDRASLPPGLITLSVRTPTGRDVDFRFEVR